MTTAREQAIEAMVWLLDAVRCGRALRFNTERMLDTLTALFDERIAHVLAEVGKTSEQGRPGLPGEASSVAGRGGHASVDDRTAPQRDPDCGISADALRLARKVLAAQAQNAENALAKRMAKWLAGWRRSN